MPKKPTVIMFMVCLCLLFISDILGVKTNAYYKLIIGQENRQIEVAYFDFDTEVDLHQQVHMRPGSSYEIPFTVDYLDTNVEKLNVTYMIELNANGDLFQSSDKIPLRIGLKHNGEVIEHVVRENNVIFDTIKPTHKEENFILTLDWPISPSSKNAKGDKGELILSIKAQQNQS